MDIQNGVVLTLTALPIDPCANEASDQITLSFTKIPVVEAGPDAFVCEDESYTFATNQAQASEYSSIQWTGGTGTWTSSNTITPTYKPSAAEISLGEVSLTLTAQGNGNCEPVSDTMTMFITKKPVLTIGSNFEICVGESLAISDVSGVNAASYAWSPSEFFDDPTSLQAVYTPATGVTGSVELTLTATPNSPCADEVVAPCRADGGGG